MRRPQLYKGRAFATNGHLAVWAPSKDLGGTYEAIPGEAGSSSEENGFSRENAQDLLEMHEESVAAGTIRRGNFRQTLDELPRGLLADVPDVQVGGGVYRPAYLRLAACALEITQLGEAKCSFSEFLHGRESFVRLHLQMRALRLVINPVSTHSAEHGIDIEDDRS